jgi:hypothetical protein
VLSLDLDSSAGVVDPPPPPPVIPVDITQPGDPIVGLHDTVAGGPNTVSTQGGGEGQYPSGEPPSNAIDNTTAKYLNFGTSSEREPGEDTGFYVTPTPSEEEMVVVGLRFQTADDSDNRDPFTFTLEGTNEDPATTTDWVLIASGDTGLQLNPGRDAWQLQGTEPVFDNNLPFTSYRLLFPTVRGADNSMQIGEVQFLGVPFVAAAIPEPSTFALAGLGLLSLAVIGRRRRRGRT